MFLTGAVLDERLEKIYRELPKKTYKLDNAYRIESKTRQFPFVVAHEVDPRDRQPIFGEDGLKLGDGAEREYLVFHDLEHFLQLRHFYPHSHEIIRCPSKFESDGLEKKKYQDDLSRGRLLFDFDLKEPLPGLDGVKLGEPLSYVPKNFKEIFERLVCCVFERYYLRVDTKKLVFVWQWSPSPTKFSLHLIVKNAFFSEYWTAQMRIFYTLLEKIAHEKHVAYLLPAIDFPLPKRNATFRMLGSSKINGQALELLACNNQNSDLLHDGGQISIYDCLAGIYSAEHLKAEQSISMDNLNYAEIEDDLQIVENLLPYEKQYQQKIRKQISILEEKPELDIADEDVSQALTIFEARSDLASHFAIRDVVDDNVNLDRRCRGNCPLSGVIHDRENAYLKLHANGHLYFYCRRGCKHGNSHGLDLGLYKKTQKPNDHPNQNLTLNNETIAMLKSAKTVVSKVARKTGSNATQFTRVKNSSKRVAMGTNIIQIPSDLRASNVLVLRP